MFTSHRKILNFGAIFIAIIMAMSVVFIEPDTVEAVSSRDQLTTNSGANQITLEECKAGKEYVVAIAKGSPSDYSMGREGLLYVNQKTAGSSTLSFTVPVKTADRVVLVVSSNDGKDSYPKVIGEINIPINEATFDISNPTYTGKRRYPSVSAEYAGKALTPDDYSWTGSGINVGTYRLNIEGKGRFTGMVNQPFKVRPVGTSIRSLKRGTKRMTVRWRKPGTKYRKQIAGYQIQYSKNSDFARAVIVSGGGYKKTSKVIKRLEKKKRYYVRIRTIKNGVVSGWSGVRSVVTR